MDFENSKIELAKAENELLITDPKSARKRKRADERRRRKYKFTDKKHSKLGIAATMMAAVSLLMIVLTIVYTTSMKGQAGNLAGFIPFISLVLSSVGIVISSITFRKPDTIYTFSWIGLVSNLVVWLFIAVVLVIGL